MEGEREYVFPCGDRIYRISLKNPFSSAGPLNYLKVVGNISAVKM